MNSASTASNWKTSVCVLLLLWCSFLAYSFGRAPIPSANEPHYLSKGLHFWNDDWCPNDLFLESSNAHLVFYQTVGWLPLYFSFESSALIGRLLGYLLLAVGWWSCFREVVGDSFRALLAAWFFLAISSMANLSGEWMVGGIESKVIAYGFLLCALGDSFRHRYYRAALWWGLTVSFHPVIGVWACCAMVGMALWEYSRTKSIPALPQLILFGLIFLASAAPGLLPALSLVGNGSSQADYIQVYFRLGHHLDPMRFSLTSYCFYIGLIVIWVVIRNLLPTHPIERRFSAFCVFTVLIAVIGLVIGLRFGLPLEMWFQELRTGLLKFYFFRLADLFVPMAAAVSLTRLVSYWASGDLFPKLKIPPLSRKLQSGLVLLVVLGIPFFVSAEGRDPSHMPRHQKEDWIDACNWISQNTPADALFLTPRHTWAFKWYAQRNEYFSYKDMPQDAASLSEWVLRYNYQRSWINDIKRNYQTNHSSGPLTAADDQLDELLFTTQATHYLLHESLQLPLEPIYQNDTYLIYELPLINVELNESE